MRNRLAARILAFARGDLLGAEDLENYPAVPTPAWLDRAAGDDDLARYALEAAVRSAERANKSLAGIQERAASFLGILLLVIPLSLAATGLAVPHKLDWLPVVSLLVAALGDVFLVSAAVAASLASGLTLGGGLNIARLDPDNAAPLAALRAAEADAWHYSAMLAFESCTRRAYDLFQARRLALLGVFFVGVGVLLSATSGALAP